MREVPAGSAKAFQQAPSKIRKSIVKAENQEDYLEKCFDEFEDEVNQFEVEQIDQNNELEKVAFNWLGT